MGRGRPSHLIYNRHNFRLPPANHDSRFRRSLSAARGFRTQTRIHPNRTTWQPLCLLCWFHLPTVLSVDYTTVTIDPNRLAATKPEEILMRALICWALVLL